MLCVLSMTCKSVPYFIMNWKVSSYAMLLTTFLLYFKLAMLFTRWYYLLHLYFQGWLDRTGFNVDCYFFYIIFLSLVFCHHLSICVLYSLVCFMYLLKNPEMISLVSEVYSLICSNAGFSWFWAYCFWGAL